MLLSLPLLAPRLGDSLEIAFDKGNPQKSVPSFKKSQEEIPWPVFFLVPAMLSFFVVPFFLPHLIPLFVARKLFVRGILTQGSLEFVKTSPLPTPYMPQGNLIFVYEFRDETGQLRRGTTRCDNSWLAMQLKPKSPVVVAYNPKRPSQNTILEPFVA